MMNLGGGLPSGTIEGSVWEHYSKGREIGTGNYATVYVATAKSSSRLRKVKEGASCLSTFEESERGDGFGHANLSIDGNTSGGTRSTADGQRRKRDRGGEIDPLASAPLLRNHSSSSSSVHSSSTSWVAIKVSPRADQIKVNALRKEWMALSLAQHPNIILAYEYFEDATECSMVIEYAAEGTLMDWLNNHSDEITEHQICTVTSQLLGAMAYLHSLGPSSPTTKSVAETPHPSPTATATATTQRELSLFPSPTSPSLNRGQTGGESDSDYYCSPLRPAALYNVVHRDIKPDNVLIVSLQPLTVRLADFGLVKACGVGEWWARPNSAGDRAVMCPGILRMMEERKPVTTDEYQKGDVYAVGVCLYTMLSGHAPFPKEVDPRDQPDYPWIQPASLTFPNISGVAIELCRNLMLGEPEERPDSNAAVSMQQAWASCLLPPSSSERRRRSSANPVKNCRNSLLPSASLCGEAHPSESDGSGRTTPAHDELGVIATHQQQ